MDTTTNTIGSVFSYYTKATALLVFALVCACPLFAQRVGGNGTIYGRIYDADANRYMQNAEITVEGTSIVTTSEQGGFYTLNNVPEGEVTVVVTYTAYVTEKKAITMTDRGQVPMDFDMHLVPSSLGGLTSTTGPGEEKKEEIITLERIVVTTERAGNARAFMEQKNSMTMSTVLATDSFGTVPNGNIAEFLRNMPGLSALEDDVTGEADQISIGGMDASLTGVYLDGARMASGAKGGFDDDSRSFRFDQISINGIESIEVRRTVSADMEGDAPAGGISMRTKSAFDNRRAVGRYDVFFTGNSYSMNLKRTPGPTDGKSLKIRPGFNFTYSTPFNKGTMGLIVQGSWQTDYRENNSADAIPQGDANMANPYLNSINFRTSQTESDRMSGSIRFDWKVSMYAKMSLSYSHDQRETTTFSRNVSFDTGRNTSFNTSNLLSLASPEADTATRNIVTQTARYDESNTENINLTFNWKRYRFTLDAVATWAYAIGKKNPTNDQWFSRASMYRSRSGASSSYSLWGERSSTSKMDWSFYRGDRQTQTPDETFMAEFGNIARYLVNGTFDAPLRSQTEQTIPTVKIDLRWDAPTKFPFWVKSGFNWRQNKTAAMQPQDYTGRELSSRYTYTRPTGGDAPAWNSTAYLSQFEFDPHFGGNVADLNIPMLDQTALYTAFKQHYEIIEYTDEEGYVRRRQNPDSWFTQNADDQWNDIISNWTAQRNLSESIYAGYVMSEARPWKNWIFQTGLRYEYTSQEAITLIPMSIQMVERELGTRDHYTQRFLSMLYKNGERTTTTNDYSFLLPSASAKYNFTPNLSGHLGYSEGFGRLSVEKLAANWKIIESTTRNAARAPNPSLEPDHYKTYSAAVEYYFEPAGSFTVTYTYRKWMGTTYDELIIENPNLDSPTPVLKALIDMYGVETLRGFMDMDYEIVTWQPSETNDRAMQTLEFSYRQRIPAIPGLQIDANFTRNVPNWRKTGAASAPKLASGGVSYSNRNFYLRVSGNWRSRYWQSWSTAADLDLKQRVGVNARFLLNAELTYRLTKWLSFYTRVDNILNAPTSQYRYSSNIVSQETLAGVAFRFGIKGDF